MNGDAGVDTGGSYISLRGFRGWDRIFISIHITWSIYTSNFKIAASAQSIYFTTL